MVLWYFGTIDSDSPIHFFTPFGDRIVNFIMYLHIFPKKKSTT